MTVYDLARPEIRDLKPYSMPDIPEDFTRMNENEATNSPYGQTAAGHANRYPEIRPFAIQSALAGLFDVDASSLCPTRGSSEGIDLLIRTFCRAYTDNVVVLPPTFEMYAAYARMQAAEVRVANLCSDSDFAVDWSLVDSQCDANTKIIFLCSPNNPTGNLISQEEILSFAEQRRDRSIVVVDEAYIEFCDRSSIAVKIEQLENLVVLRTLSKAYALAGARCGAVIGSNQLIQIISAMMSPFAFSAPVHELVLLALQPANVEAANRQITATVRERRRMESLLQELDVTERVWRSDANFIYVQFCNLAAVHEAVTERQIVIREFGNNRDNSDAPDCARITVGSVTENNRLLDALNSAGGATK